jgi:hypothetical protein
MSSSPTPRSISVLAKGRVSCERCETPLEGGPGARKFHTTWYSPNLALSPLCEPCWAGLTLAGRMQFYRIRWNHLCQTGSAEMAAELWEQIRRAVTKESKP